MMIRCIIHEEMNFNFGNIILKFFFAEYCMHKSDVLSSDLNVYCMNFCALCSVTTTY